MAEPGPVVWDNWVVDAVAVRPGDYYIYPRNPEPVRPRWADTQGAAARAVALLRSNIAEHEMLHPPLWESGLRVRGEVSHYPYTLVPVGSAGPVQVTLRSMHCDRPICWFCVYTKDTAQRPVADELLAMALWIKHAERDFVLTAVPHTDGDGVSFFRVLHILGISRDHCRW